MPFSRHKGKEIANYHIYLDSHVNGAGNLHSEPCKQDHAHIDFGRDRSLLFPNLKELFSIDRNHMLASTEGSR